MRQRPHRSPASSCSSKLLCLSLCALTVLTLGGCGSDGASPLASSEPGATVVDLARGDNSTHAANVTPDTNDIAPSAGNYSVDINGATNKSLPTQVCDAFVRSLHDRDIVSAERLLTLASRIVIHDSELELAPLAGPNASYVIGEVKYATKLQQLAYVDCHVFDPEMGEDSKFLITWMLKEEASYGWRICGMLSVEDGQQRIVNFENPRHAQAISEKYGDGLELDGPEFRQADAQTDSQIK